MSEERSDYTLQQVAAIIPCHERVLRRHMKVPGTIPPFVWDDVGQRYRFPRAGVQQWLQARAAIREAMQKPYLRWLPVKPQQHAA